MDAKQIEMIAKAIRQAKRDAESGGWNADSALRYLADVIAIEVMGEGFSKEDFKEVAGFGFA